MKKNFLTIQPNHSHSRPAYSGVNSSGNPFFNQIFANGFPTKAFGNNAIVVARNFCVLLLLAILFVAPSSAQLDRSKIPPPGPAPAIAFPNYELLTTRNGIRVIIVRNTELPTVSMHLLIDRKPALEGTYAGVIDIAGQLLRDGTTTRTKDQLDEEVDVIGAELSSGGTTVSASGLSKYTGKLFELMSDITLRPSFPQDELDKLKMQTESGLKFRKTEPNAIVNVVRQRILYGNNHPYGEVETEQTVANITRDKCIETYNAYFKPNHAILAVVGDVKKDEVMKLVEKYFGTWNEGDVPNPTFETPKPLDRTEVALVDRASSVQSVIRIAQTVELQRTSPDVMPVSVMNTLLGGGSYFRLFENLREKHGYTYGAYSSIGPDELIGAFTASTSARNSVTDSSIAQMIYEIKRIRAEKPDSTELQMAKNYMSGGFVRSLENPGTIAQDAIEIERYHLPKNYYKTYLKRLDEVTAGDVEQAAEKYLHPDHELIAVVGKASEIKSTLTQFGPVAMYDEEGNLIPEKPAENITITPDEIFNKFMEKSGGKAKLDSIKDKTMEMSGTMMGMTISVKTVEKAPNKVYSESKFGEFSQKTGFDGEHGWMSSARGEMEMTGKQLEGMKIEAQTNFYEHYKEMGVTPIIAGTKIISGKGCYEVHFTTADSVEFSQYFSKDDFLKVRDAKTLDTPQGPIEQITDYSDYKDFNGYLVPTHIVQSVMGRSIELKLDKFSVNTGVEDSLFVKP
ncbi:MAG: insulinase family protein [Bacteroidota bacterium]|nr:insulinase family protein [Bacteroidota bacterium]